jgi:hypothetical protein
LEAVSKNNRNLKNNKIKGELKMTSLVITAILMFAFFPFLIEGIMLYRNN